MKFPNKYSSRSNGFVLVNLFLNCILYIHNWVSKGGFIFMCANYIYIVCCRNNNHNLW